VKGEERTKGLIPPEQEKSQTTKKRSVRRRIKKGVKVRKSQTNFLIRKTRQDKEDSLAAADYVNEKKGKVKKVVACIMSKQGVLLGKGRVGITLADLGSRKGSGKLEGRRPTVAQRKDAAG